MSTEPYSVQRPTPTIQSDLEPDAIGLLGATMQAVTHIAPAVAGFFFTAFIVSLAGITAPLAYFIGFVIVLMLGSTLAQLAKHMPSAGGYYTYVSRAVHPRAGFLVSWMYILYSPLVAGPLSGFFGFIIAGQLQENYGISVPWLWWVSVLVFAPLTAFLQWEGIKLSTRFMVITGGIEMLLVMALAIFGFLFPPAGTSITLEVFNPANIPAAPDGFFAGTFFLAVVFTVQGLTGWEASAPLAEETRDPKRNVPLSIMLSIVGIGTFLVIVFWGVITGFGNDADAVANSPVLPALALAHRVWGDLDFILLFAFLNSVAAVCIACANVGTRMWYSMARSGSFPKALAVVHPTHKTPTNAILLQMVLNIGAGLVGGFIWGADISFFLLVGLVLVLAVTVAYLMANLAVFLFYWNQKRDEFSWILHFVFPIVSSAVLIFAVYKSFPAASPFDLAPFIDGGWLILGILVLIYLRMRGNEEWLTKAGASIGESV
ncbi:MAG: APC family permease [Candidatus Limnocylindria bacterium]